MKHLGRNLVSGSMGRVHDNFQTFEREIAGEGALAEFDVAPGGIVQAAGLAQAGRIHPHRRLFQRRFDRPLPVVREFGALGAEKLDAVVRKRVVACADDHAQAGPQGTGEIRHGGRRHRPQQHHIDASRVEARFQRGLQHVAGNAGVLADQHRRMVLGALEHPAHRVGKPQHEVRCDRRLAHGAANAIGSKVFSCHPSVSWSFFAINT
jgi:hypothetical protein